MSLRLPRLKVVHDGGAAGLIGAKLQLTLFVAKAGILSIFDRLAHIGESILLYLLILLLKHVLSLIYIPVTLYEQFLHVLYGKLAITRLLLDNIELFGLACSFLIGYYHWSRQRLPAIWLPVYLLTAGITYVSVWKIVVPSAFPDLEKGLREFLDIVKSYWVSLDEIILGYVLGFIVSFLGATVLRIGFALMNIVLQDWIYYMVISLFAFTVTLATSWGVNNFMTLINRTVALLGRLTEHRPTWFALGSTLLAVFFVVPILALVGFALVTILGFLLGMVFAPVIAYLTGPAYLAAKLAGSILGGSSGITASLWIQWLLNKYVSPELTRRLFPAFTFLVVLFLTLLIALTGVAAWVADLLWASYVLLVYVEVASMLLSGPPRRPRALRALVETLVSMAILLALTDPAFLALTCPVHGIGTALDVVFDFGDGLGEAAKMNNEIFCRICTSHFEEFVKYAHADTICRAVGVETR